MVSVDVSELKDQWDRLLHEVEDQGQTIAITRFGRVVAHIEPAADLAAPPAGATHHDVELFLAQVDALAAEIGKVWPEGVSAVDAIRDVRRDL